ncbi:L-threonylcarbamoyladenylate synthase [Breznakiella homolactica]|uniref:L-threonylcarbamoyladenylate synthase n=1 Tax=Breznakiella homolactica TaxID=2798577 RepID=A0A7T8BA89_9SPIR|nr:L-threonylcarbamoyladenylate synthase [Breznakiella homolactica]QQO09272.1 L-threonylcarbamoyladenylate synthase [Breznakiella homolactica]
MIEYVVANNIDDRILTRAADTLSAGGLLALPSDTSWVIVCSMKSKDGIKKLRRLSGEREERYFTLLCSDISQFGEFCSMDNTRFRIIKRLSPGPYVFILKTLLGTEKALDIRRREVGVRIPDHPVPIKTIETLGVPLYSITAKKSMASGGDPDSGGPEAAEDQELPPIPEEELFEGGWELEEIDGVDLILDTGEERPRIFSTILDLTEDEVKLVRRGAGPWPV